MASQTCERAAYELLVVDDEPAAATRALVEAFAADPEAPPARYLAVTGAHGPAAARNLGWRAARGDVVAFTDDDCVPQPGWVAAGAAALARGGDAVFGRLEMPLRDRPSDYERDAARLAGAGFVTANCFCRRAALEALGGFDERFRRAWREDSDLFLRLVALGGRVRPAPEAVVLHPIRRAPWGVSLAQQAKCADDALLFRKHGRACRERLGLAPPWRYYAVVACASAGLAALALGWTGPALAAAALWTAFTLDFARRRLRGNSRAPAHVAEMLVTSALIPPVALYWRWRGALRHRVLFL